MPRHVRQVSKRARPKLKVARLVIFDKHIEMRLNGFELDELYAIKDECMMRWDKADEVWVVSHWDYRRLKELLIEGGFIIRETQGE